MPSISTIRSARSSGLAQAASLVGAFAMMTFSAPALALPHLRCALTQGDTAQVLDFTPEQDPYSAKAIDVKGNFRFKAVVIGNEQKIDYIKLYAYYLSKRQAVLLHEAKYLAPAVQSAAGPAALTGVNYLYSPELGRELQYACALIEVAP